MHLSMRMTSIARGTIPRMKKRIVFKFYMIGVPA